MRFLLASILAALSLPAFAQAAFSIDFTQNPIRLSAVNPFRQGMTIRATGTLPGGVIVDYTYGFQGHAGFAGKVTLTDRNREAFVEIVPLVPGVYVGTTEGSAALSYLVSGEVQKTTKSASILVTDNGLEATMPSFRVVESIGPPMQTAIVRLSKPAAVPIEVRIDTSSFDGGANAGSDYSIIDNVLTFEPGTTSRPLRFRIEQDNAAEKPEWFNVHLRVHDGSRTVTFGFATITIFDQPIRATLRPERMHVFSGDSFTLSLSLSQPTDHPGNYFEPPHIASLVASDPSVVIGDPRQTAIPRGATSIPLYARSARVGTATVRAVFPDWLAIAPAEAEVHVYTAKLALDVASPLDVPLGERLLVPLTLTPAPPEAINLKVLEESPVVRYVDTEWVERLDDAGRATLGITGRTLGATTLNFYSPGGKRLLASLEVNVVPPLAIHSMAPPTGRAGTILTFTGSGFRPPCVVMFGDTASPNVTILQDSTLLATAPPHAPGTVDVVVSCSNGAGALPSAFTYLASRTRAVRH